jgi:hypothetical protein
MATEWVEIRHPEVERTATVARSAVAHHAKAGWREVGSEPDVPDSVPDSYNPDPIPDDVPADPTTEEEL